MNKRKWPVVNIDYVRVGEQHTKWNVSHFSKICAMQWKVSHVKICARWALTVTHYKQFQCITRYFGLIGKLINGRGDRQSWWDCVSVNLCQRQSEPALLFQFFEILSFLQKDLLNSLRSFIISRCEIGFYSFFLSLSLCLFPTSTAYISLQWRSIVAGEIGTNAWHFFELACNPTREMHTQQLRTQNTINATHQKVISSTAKIIAAQKERKREREQNKNTL